MDSIWLEIPDYPNYRVSPEGNILSLHRNRKLKNNIRKDGYVQVILMNKNGRKDIMTHRLVAMVYCDNPENKPQVNHIDGNKQNNHFTNLEWCTRSENAMHSYKVLGNKAPRGSKCGASKLKENDVLEIFRNNKHTILELSNKYGVAPDHIRLIKRKKVWKHLLGEL